MKKIYFLSFISSAILAVLTIVNYIAEIIVLGFWNASGYFEIIVYASFTIMFAKFAEIKGV